MAFKDRFELILVLIEINLVPWHKLNLVLNGAQSGRTVIMEKWLVMLEQKIKLRYNLEITISK